MLELVCQKLERRACNEQVKDSHWPALAENQFSETDFI